LGNQTQAELSLKNKIANIFLTAPGSSTVQQRDPDEHLPTLGQATTERAATVQYQPVR
jgi:hypothetical protein